MFKAALPENVEDGLFNDFDDLHFDERLC